MATILERVRKVTMAQLSVTEAEVTPEASFVGELGADSLDLVELIMALEEEFTTVERKITIPDEDAEKILTVQDAVDYIRDLGISDVEAPPKPAEKPSLPKITLPRNMPKSGAPSPKPGSQQNKPASGQPKGGQPRRDNRPRRERFRGNVSRPHSSPRQSQPPPREKPSEPGKQLGQAS